MPASQAQGSEFDPWYPQKIKKKRKTKLYQHKNCHLDLKQTYRAKQGGLLRCYKETGIISYKCRLVVKNRQGPFPSWHAQHDQWDQDTPGGVPFNSPPDPVTNGAFGKFSHEQPATLAATNQQRARPNLFSNVTQAGKAYGLQVACVILTLS